MWGFFLGKNKCALNTYFVRDKLSINKQNWPNGEMDVFLTSVTNERMGALVPGDEMKP